MENKKFAEWLIEMIVLSKQLPEKIYRTGK